MKGVGRRSKKGIFDLGLEGCIEVCFLMIMVGKGIWGRENIMVKV